MLIIINNGLEEEFVSSIGKCWSQFQGMNCGKSHEFNGYGGRCHYFSFMKVIYCVPLTLREGLRTSQL